MKKLLREVWWAGASGKKNKIKWNDKTKRNWESEVKNVREKPWEGSILEMKGR